MKTKTRTTKGIAVAMTVLALASASFAQQQEKPPIPGTYYSAKDFEWSPPWPFNPHPELEAVEVEPGIFVFDDTMIPDTPEQAAARVAHQAAVEHAKAIAANPALAEAERAARQAAQETAWKANKERLAPWLVKPLAVASGAPANRETVEAEASTKLTAKAGQFATYFQALSNEVAAAKSPFVVNDPAPVLILPSGERLPYAGSVGGHPMFLGLDDVPGADTISTDEVWPGGSTGLSLTGTNMVVAMWDGGRVLLEHTEFDGRVTQVDGATSTNSHATGVASVIAATGKRALVHNGTNFSYGTRGMAYTSFVRANENSGDFQKMSDQFATNQIRLSNHSYSTACGWTPYSFGWVWWGDTNLSQNVDWKFGAYTTNSSSIDSIVADSETYLPVWTPGNSRGQGPLSQPLWHYLVDTNFQLIPVFGSRPLDGDTGGYDSLHPHGCAKNNLTVGAANVVSNGYSGPASVTLPSFTPYGPTDDGRIKPDVVAAGVNIVMADIGSTNAYQTNSGTSFSAPSVTGSVNLLRQLRGQLHPNARPTRASTMKGIVIHTADECGPYPGPDYAHGWGLMNTRKAAELLQQNATNGWKSFIKEIYLPEGGTIEIPAPFSTGQTGRFTMVWSDPPGAAQTNAVLDSPTPRLVNDLDLRVISPSGVTNFPYVLSPDLTNQNPAVRAAAATTGDDSRNNVEQAVITNTVAGTYLARITHKGSLSGGGQWVTWAMSGGQAAAKPALVLSQPTVTGSNTIAFGWPSVVGQLYQVQYVDNLEGASWSNWNGEISAITTNTMVEVDMTGPEGRRFYRVMEVE